MLHSLQYYVYILESQSTGEYYTGYPKDIKVRLAKHNFGHNKATKNGQPLKIVYTESYSSRYAAMQRENELRHKKSNSWIKRLINNDTLVKSHGLKFLD